MHRRKRSSSMYTVHRRTRGCGLIRHHRPLPRAKDIPGRSTLVPCAVSISTVPAMACTIFACTNTARFVGMVRTISIAVNTPRMRSSGKSVVL
jgi:hypothetical protein